MWRAFPLRKILVLRNQELQFREISDEKWDEVNSHDAGEEAHGTQHSLSPADLSLFEMTRSHAGKLEELQAECFAPWWNSAPENRSHNGISVASSEHRPTSAFKS